MTNKAYVLGRNAYCDGKRLSDNPYNRVTADAATKFRDWERGFIETERNDPLQDDEAERS